ncbi:MAG: (Serine-type) D-alanyl-D-alanine carboxypeptidase [Modestobacter sp.]|jgi:hypothetical protein|nr:(Serine-type) D-alanyl-D-alanine carboxypeptidase [Modestobacter sp.]
MNRWERALYSGRLLPAEQQAELTSLVSARTGRPIERTSATDPQGCALGFAQLTTLVAQGVVPVATAHRQRDPDPFHAQSGGADAPSSRARW